MDRLVRHCATGNLVVFAGAGVSMPPPTCLPSWKAVNEVILDALADRLVVFTDEDFARELRDRLVATRDDTTWFTPDYQAQLIEDEIGGEYFRVLRALDTDDRNGAHEAIAMLAAHGCLAAIVTTNFDRLLERALDSAGVGHRVYFERAQLATLPDVLAGGTTGCLPLIKVHGSIEAPDSMVDTLRQRLMERPEGLEEALCRLMADNHVLFVGFSGADLSYDPEYLGLRRAAASNQGFTCLVRPGDEPVDMRALAAVWGDEAVLVDGNLPEWLGALLALAGLPAADVHDALAVDRAPALRASADAWAGSLGHMVSVSIMAALLSSSGRDELAFELLARTMRSSVSQRDMHAPGYASFNYQLGHRLLERGAFDVSVETSRRREVERNKQHISPFTGNDCFQCLHRSMSHLAGVIDMGLYETYWGMPGTGAERIRQARDAAIEQRAVGRMIDACLALAVVYEILMQYADALDWLEHAYALAVKLGDEPRRARLCAELSRFLAMRTRHDEADRRVREGLAVAERLGLRSTRLQLLSARGSALVEQRRTGEALDALIAAADGQREMRSRPALARTLLDVSYAHFQARDWSAMEAATDELIELTDVYAGYRPLLCLMRARFAAWADMTDDAHHWIRLAKSAADTYQNPGVREEVTILESRLAPT